MRATNYILNKGFSKADYCHLAAIAVLIGAEYLIYIGDPNSSISTLTFGNGLAFLVAITVIIYSAQQARRKQQIEMQLSGTLEELKKKQIFCDSIFETSRDCIKVVDLDCKLIFMNTGGQRLLEICDFAPLSGANWLEFWGENDKQSAKTAVNIAKAGGVGQFRGFFPTTQTQTPMWFDVVITADRKSVV